MFIDVLVEHKLGECIAGLLTGYSPGSSLSTEEVATAKRVGGDYAWLSHVTRYALKSLRNAELFVMM